MSLRDSLTSDKARERYDRNYYSFEETFTMKELEEHDEEIRANERKKFAEWIAGKFGVYDEYGNRYGFEELIECYKKECEE